MNDVNLPWIIVIGYAAGGLFLWARSKIKENGAPGATAMAVLSVLFFAGTTVFWLSSGFTRFGLVYGVAAAAAIVTVIVVLRKRRLKTPLQHGTSGPTFGVFPSSGRTWPVRGPAPELPPRSAEFEHQGHRLLGFEYDLGGTFSLTELRIPPGPALLIAPRSMMSGGATLGSPMKDARLGHTAFGTPKPADVQPMPVDPEFDKRYDVSTNDPAFATAVLTPEIRATLQTDPVFQGRAFAFDQDALWTVDSGGMSRDRIISSGRTLALFAAAVAPVLWRGTAFGAVVAGAQTSVEAWRGQGGGSVLAGVNARRELASRKPMTGLALTVRSAIALALLVGCALPTVNAVAALTGQAETIPLTVTSTGVRDTCYDRKTGHRDLICGKNEHLVVDGTYEVGGVQHQARVTGPPGHPEVGDTVPLKIGPVWWHPVFDSTFTAWFMLVFTVPGLLLGAWLAKATYLPRPPRRIRRERKQAERPRLAPPLH